MKKNFETVATTERFPSDKSQEYFALHIHGNISQAGKFWWNGMTWTLEIDKAQSPVYEDRPISSVYWLEETKAKIIGEANDQANVSGNEGHSLSEIKKLPEMAVCKTCGEKDYSETGQCIKCFNVENGFAN